uniref:Photosystem I assembly protein Ycf4 n=1 Tax=Scherffelia dubia TaxID=3190 RepID=A0A142BY97_SCHDU|nr:hypothetical chloroplast RF4 [Scherffelia dubia]AMP43389.1 hypothetical chloroplast RF4 [Scherffelia dubia]
MEYSSDLKESQLIRRYNIVGSRRFSNLFWASFLTIGGFYFLITGLSSYFRFSFFHSDNIIFFPQGLVMCFYGLLALFLSIYLWLTILWQVGGGFNEFNKKKGTFRFFRWGFPGKNRRIDFLYPLEEIEALRIQVVEGVNPKRIIYIRIKEKKEIPLTGISQPLTLEEIEKQASDLAIFLEVSLDS